MAPRSKLVGGPLCGRATAPHSESFIWVAVHADMVRVYGQPGEGRWLYRYEEDGDYVYAGHRFARCPGCGGVVAREEEACQLCGAQMK